MNTSTRVEFGLYDVTARSDSAPVTEDPAKTVWDSAVACRTAADGAQRLRRVVW